MKAGGSKRKGSSFERVVAKMIIDAGKYLDFNKEDCYRTPASGGHPIARLSNPSDLVLSKRVLKHFPVSVECKHIRWVDLQLLFKGGGKFFSWLAQSLRAAKASNVALIPIVVFKWNNSQVFCIYPSDGFSALGKKSCYMRFYWKNRFWRMALFLDLLDSVFDASNGNYKKNF